METVVDSTMGSKTKMKPAAFLKKVNDSLTVGNVPTSSRLKKCASLRREIRQQFQDAYSNDVHFRDALVSTLNQDPKFSASVSRMREGTCSKEGTCSVPQKERPTSKLFTGKECSAHFERDLLTGDVVFQNGGSFKVEAKRCSTVDPDTMCYEEDPSVVLPVYSEAGKAHLPEGVPPHKGFRISFGNDVFVVENKIKVPASPTEAEDCAVLLCERNSSSCPAPYCKKEGERCVPGDADLPNVTSSALG